MELFLIDNFDSFTYNLAHLLSNVLKCNPRVVSYSEFRGEHLNGCEAVVISPGPGKPCEYPKYEILRDCDRPILGICLGMQILNELYDGSTDVLDDCVHGKTDEIEMEGRKFTVARYHSLFVSKVASNFQVVSQNRQGIPMAIRHINKPIVGFQFHPESFMTSEGQYFIDYAFNCFKKISV